MLTLELMIIFYWAREAIVGKSGPAGPYGRLRACIGLLLWLNEAFVALPVFKMVHEEP